MLRHIFVISCLFLAAFSCQQENKQVETKAIPNLSGLLPDNYVANTHDLGLAKLSEYNFFAEPLNKLIPKDDKVIPYELNSTLFTDYASKKRFIVLPENTKMEYNEREAFDFPDGTVIVKNFYYEAAQLDNCLEDKIIETRLLIKDKETQKWDVLPYVWNESQTEAFFYILGKDVTVKTKNRAAFTYAVPNINSCKNCHNKNQEIVPIGPNARQLNRMNNYNGKLVNQLTFLHKNNFLNGLPPIDAVDKLPDYSDATSGDLNQRARAYLDINCAHCHQSEGAGKTSGLYLTYYQEDPYKLGINKAPIAAGKGSGNLSYDIVKGKPEESIFVHRMSSLELDVVMPEIGKSLRHEEGIDLISEWIAALE